MEVPSHSSYAMKCNSNQKKKKTTIQYSELKMWSLNHDVAVEQYQNGVKKEKRKKREKHKIR